MIKSTLFRGCCLPAIHNLENASSAPRAQGANHNHCHVKSAIKRRLINVHLCVSPPLGSDQCRFISITLVPFQTVLSVINHHNIHKVPHAYVSIQCLYLTPPVGTLHTMPLYTIGKSGTSSQTYFKKYISADIRPNTLDRHHPHPLLNQAHV